MQVKHQTLVFARFIFANYFLNFTNMCCVSLFLCKMNVRVHKQTKCFCFQAIGILLQ